MNMHERQNAVKRHGLENLIRTQPNYSGYPETRYHDSSGVPNITVPAGQWDTEQAIPTLEETASLRAQMCRIDNMGRPVHPWFEEMVSSIGVVAGRGKYQKWGVENRTVDPIVITKESTPQLLLVERSDNGAWAFPGGFLDHPAESTTNASRRECLEETGLELFIEPKKIIYQGVVADGRTTAHAWAYTTAKLWRIEQPEFVKGEDDALDAKWFPIDKLPENLHGSHAKIIELALLEL